MTDGKVVLRSNVDLTDSPEWKDAPDWSMLQRAIRISLPANGRLKDMWGTQHIKGQF